MFLFSPVSMEFACVVKYAGCVVFIVLIRSTINAYEAYKIFKFILLKSTGRRTISLDFLSRIYHILLLRKHRFRKHFETCFSFLSFSSLLLIITTLLRRKNPFSERFYLALSTRIGLMIKTCIFFSPSRSPLVFKNKMK